MSRVPKLLYAAVILAVCPLPSVAQKAAAVAVAGPAPSYPVFADLVLASPLIVDATVRSTARIKGPEAVNVAPGRVRFYVEADVLALIRGPRALPPRIGFVADLALDARGKAPTLKKTRLLLFARPVAGNAGQIQLVRPDAMRIWSPGANELTRRITTEAVAARVPPEITGLGSAFHVSGSLPGDGETQIFLTTRDDRPVSLGIVRRRDAARRWGVSLGDVVDESGATPARDTLLWYRLACALPAALPDSAVAEITPENAVIAREDYRFVLESLGRCDRGTR